MKRNILLLLVLVGMWQAFSLEGSIPPVTGVATLDTWLAQTYGAVQVNDANWNYLILYNGGFPVAFGNAICSSNTNQVAGLIDGLKNYVHANPSSKYLARQIMVAACGIAYGYRGMSGYYDAFTQNGVEFYECDQAAKQLPANPHNPVRTGLNEAPARCGYNNDFVSFGTPDSQEQQNEEAIKKGIELGVEIFGEIL
ncbi:MAG: hypothetical protein NTX86_04035 [Candidatus Dependentiae bacterium]|nr:hypothetical protein [Candidatus Dependentiae bacterium]